MAATGPSPTVLRAGTPIDGASLAAQLAAVAQAGIRSVACDVAAVMPNAAAVDRLARLRLAACRFGCELQLRRVPAELQQLLSFVGLAEVLRVEVRRQAEDREQRVGVEEERELGDAIA